MSKKDYELLGVDEGATDEQIRARYEELRNKYSEERFLEGAAGNEAARMLGRIEVAYNEIMAERAESVSSAGQGTSFAQVEEHIRAGRINEAQAVLDAFNERPAEWHYLQSVIFYRKNWISESKKQLEIAIEMDGGNEKYQSAYAKLKEKMEYEKRQAEMPRGGSYQGGTYRGGNRDSIPSDDNQMGGGFCEQCATCCACNVLFNLCLNACCGCR